MEILELESTITKLKILLGTFNNRSESGEERISEPEDKAVEIIQSEEQKEKRMKMNRALEKCGHH